MGHNFNHAPLLALMVVIVFTAVADGQSAININGVLKCPTNGVGLQGLTVQLNCTNLLGVTSTIANGTTGVNGVININATTTNILRTLPILNGNILPCYLGVRLPVNTILCPILNQTNNAVLAAVPVIIGTTGGLLGGVLNLLATGFGIVVNIGI